jgi:hypothetical protein
MKEERTRGMKEGSLQKLREPEASKRHKEAEKAWKKKEYNGWNKEAHRE